MPRTLRRWSFLKKSPRHLGALCCTGRGSGRTGHYPVPGSCDADGLRASQLQHAVERVDADVDLGHAAPVGARVQSVPYHPLVPRDSRLGPGAGVVARRLLPSHAPLLGDELEVAVPLRRRSLGRLARHRRRARRDDDLRLGVALGHVGVNTFLIVRAVRRDGGDRVRDLVEQGTDLGGVVHVAVGQRGRHDPAGPGVHAQVHLAPGAAPLRAVLLHQPLARAVELQPRAVHQQVQGLGVVAVARPRAARLRPRHLQRLGPAAQGGVVGHGEVEPEQADDRADQPLGLAVGEAEHGLERQRRQDRQVGIRGLPAPTGAPLGLPRRDRLVREPHRQAAAPAQALVVLPPVRDTVGEFAGCALASLLDDQLRGAAMSLRPAEIAPVPARTAQVAVAAFPRGCAAMRMRDELGAIYDDQMFASLFPARGQPAYSPWRLALVTVLQFAEGLPDRQAADAVRGRIDWKYALSLELTDPGFDFSVLCEFRARLIAGGLEQSLLEAMLTRYRV